jgi:hypothetical protein
LLLLPEQCLDEALGVEGFDVFGGFAEAYEFDGDVELLGDGDDGAAFGGGVEDGGKLWVESWPSPLPSPGVPGEGVNGVPGEGVEVVREVLWVLGCLARSNDEAIRIS